MGSYDIDRTSFGHDVQIVAFALPTYYGSPCGNAVKGDIALVATELADGGNASDPFESHEELAATLFRCSLRASSDEQIHLIALHFESSWYQSTLYFQIRGYSLEKDTVIEQSSEDRQIEEAAVEKIVGTIRELSDRALAVGGKVKPYWISIPAINSGILVAKLRSSGNSSLRGRLSEEFNSRMIDIYSGSRNTEIAVTYGKIAIDLTQSPTIKTNLAYIYLIRGDCDESRRLLTEAIDQLEGESNGDEPEITEGEESEKAALALSYYNLAICDCIENLHESTLERAKHANHLIKNLPYRRRIHLFLLMIAEQTGDSSAMALTKVENFDLLVATERTIAGLSTTLSTSDRESK